MPNLRFAALALACLSLAAGCAAPPDHEQQAAAIEANVQQTFDGDVGALIYHGYEAARLAEESDAARAELSSLPSYSPANINISDKANEMSEQAAEQRRQAEAALNRILDPLRERIAKLEQQGKLQTADTTPGNAAPAGAASLTAVLRFPAGSPALPEKETAKLQAVTSYLARHPHAAVTITGWPDSAGGGSQNRLSRARADAVYAALVARGLPPETAVAISALPPPGDDAAGQRVEIEVRPQG